MTAVRQQHQQPDNDDNTAPSWEIDWQFVREREAEIVEQVIAGGKFGSLGCVLLPVALVAGLVLLFVYLPAALALLLFTAIAFFVPGKHVAYSTDPAVRDHGRRHARLATATLVMGSPKLFERPGRGGLLARHGIFAVRYNVHAASAVITLDDKLGTDTRRLRELARVVASLATQPEGGDEARQPELKPLAERAKRGRTLVTDSRGNYLPAVYLPNSLCGNDATFEAYLGLHREIIPNGFLDEQEKSLEWTRRFPVVVAEGTHQVRAFLVPYWFWNEALYRTTSPRRYPHAEMAVVEGLADPLPAEAAEWPVVSRDSYRGRSLHEPPAVGA